MNASRGEMITASKNHPKPDRRREPATTPTMTAKISQKIANSTSQFL